MKYAQFVVEFLQTNMLQNIAIIGLCIFFQYKIFKKSITNVFDPYFIYFVFEQGCSIAIILWLFFSGYINGIILLEFSLLFAFYIIGFKTGEYTKTYRMYVYKMESDNFFMVFYTLHTLLFAAISLRFFRNIGLANLSEGKLAARSGNSILIYFQELLSTGQFIVFFLKRKMYNKKSIWDFLVILIFLLNAFSSGSKGSLVVLCTMYFTLNILIDKYILKKDVKYKLVNKKVLFAIVISIIGIIAVMKIQGNTSKGNTFFLSFLTHLFEFGDVYYLAFPNDVYTNLPKYSLAKYFIIPLLGPIRRLLPFPDNSTLGYDLVRIIYGYKDPWFGPLARVFMVLFLSKQIICSIIICFVIGYLFARVRRCDFFYGSFFGIYFSFYMLFSVGIILSGFNLFAVSFLPLVTIFPFLYGVTFIICKSLRIRCYKCVK